MDNYYNDNIKPSTLIKFFFLYSSMFMVGIPGIAEHLNTLLNNRERKITYLDWHRAIFTYLVEYHILARGEGFTIINNSQHNDLNCKKLVKFTHKPPLLYEESGLRRIVIMLRIIFQTK
jgi:hypothetical protein